MFQYQHMVVVMTSLISLVAKIAYAALNLECPRRYFASALAAHVCGYALKGNIVGASRGSLVGLGSSHGVPWALARTNSTDLQCAAIPLCGRFEDCRQPGRMAPSHDPEYIRRLPSFRETFPKTTQVTSCRHCRRFLCKIYFMGYFDSFIPPYSRRYSSLAN